MLRWWENDKNQRVLEIICVLVRAVALACRGHHELVLENLALRQQLNAMRRMRTRPQLRTRDRLFWITLAQIWRHWRTALVFVQPETAVAESAASPTPQRTGCPMRDLARVSHQAACRSYRW